MSGASFTYNSYEQDKTTPTFGGYSDNIVVNEDFAFTISPNLDLSRVAPLLCAGITTYSPLQYWKVCKGQKVGVIGLGGLGHMAIKFAKQMGAHVILLTTSPDKSKDALQLGTDEVIISTDIPAMNTHANSMDLILSTVSGDYDINLYLSLLKCDGVMVVLGIPPTAAMLQMGKLINPRRKLAGSLIGGIAETQTMLNYCAKYNILANVEVIPIEQINHAYERMIMGDVKYRFVIDMKSLK
jgi:uncharacterized zinc-type alcohol dehydrogenase-like protein